jgi:cobalt transporter subunit CbtA
MFQKILTSALFAGFAAGLISALLQFWFVQPVLVFAELYETGALVHFGAGATSPDAGAQLTIVSFDLVRNGLSVLFAALLFVGYGLILIATMSFAETRGADITVQNGVVWGICGFVAWHFTPAFGLAPELPGASAAEVLPRQLWWFGCVIATAGALWIFAFHQSTTMIGLAIVLALLPHVIGAPQPEAFNGPTPPELGGLFAARTLGVGFVSWVVLGVLSAHFWSTERDG